MLSADLRCDVRHTMYPSLRGAHMRRERPAPPALGCRPPMISAEYATRIVEPVWKACLGVPETQLAALHPGFEPWRKFNTTQILATILYQRFDALHLAGAEFVNDANGLADGRNAIQAYRATLEELREKLGDSRALSVDAFNEIAYGLADLAQLRLPELYEIDVSRPFALRFDEQLAERTHPLTARLLRRAMIPYMPIEHPAAEFDEAWTAWARATAPLAPLGKAADLRAEHLENPPAAMRACWPDAGAPTPARNEPLAP